MSVGLSVLQECHELSTAIGGWFTLRWMTPLFHIGVNFTETLIAPLLHTYWHSIHFSTSILSCFLLQENLYAFECDIQFSIKFIDNSIFLILDVIYEYYDF